VVVHNGNPSTQEAEAGIPSSRTAWAALDLCLKQHFEEYNIKKIAECMMTI
jgi:hypothetical protein